MQFHRQTANWGKYFGKRFLDRRLYFLILLMLGLRAGLGGADEKPSQSQSQQNYDRAFLLVQQGKLGEALTELDAAIAKDPQQATLHNLRGLAASQLGRDQEAAASFQRVIKLAPQSAMGYNNLAALLYRQGKTSEAEELFRQALKQEPQNLTAWRGLGTVLAASQKHSVAVAFLEKAWQVDPGDFQTGYELARVLRELKRPAQATKVLERVKLTGTPEIDAKYFQLSAIVAEDQGSWTKAAGLYRRAYELAPGSFEIYLGLVRGSLREADAPPAKTLPTPPAQLTAEQHFALGLLLASRRAYEQAAPHFEETLRLEPTSYSAAYNLAVAYEGSAQFQNAIQLIERVLEKNPTAELYHLLASLEERTDRLVEAVRHFQKAVELEPSNEQYVFDLGLEYLAHFTFGPALEVFETGTRRFAEVSRQYVGKGMAHYGLREFLPGAEAVLTALEKDSSSRSAHTAWTALEAFLGPPEWRKMLPRLQRLAELHPENAEVQLYVGQALMSISLSSQDTGEIRLAQNALEKAIRLKPSLADAHLALGSLFSAQKEQQKAIEAFQEALRLAPQSEMAVYRLGQAYRDMGKLELAQQQLERHAELIKNRREQMARTRGAIKQFVLAQSPTVRPGKPRGQEKAP